jgi:hypothetical protein
MKDFTKLSTLYIFSGVKNVLALRNTLDNISPGNNDKTRGNISAPSSDLIFSIS